MTRRELELPGLGVDDLSHDPAGSDDDMASLSGLRVRPLDLPGGVEVLVRADNGALDWLQVVQVFLWRDSQSATNGSFHAYGESLAKPWMHAFEIPCTELAADKAEAFREFAHSCQLSPGGLWRRELGVLAPLDWPESQ